MTAGERQYSPSPLGADAGLRRERCAAADVPFSSNPPPRKRRPSAGRTAPPRTAWAPVCARTTAQGGRCGCEQFLSEYQNSVRMSFDRLRPLHVCFRPPSACASEPSPARWAPFLPMRNKSTAKQLKRLETAKPPTSLRLRPSDNSPSKRSSSFRFPFVSFRPVSPALHACAGCGGECRSLARSAWRRSPRGPRRSPCGRPPLATVWILF